MIYSLELGEMIQHIVKIKCRRKDCYPLILLPKKKYWQHQHALRLWIDKSNLEPCWNTTASIYQQHQRRLICQCAINLLKLLKIQLLIWKIIPIKQKPEKSSAVSWRWEQSIAIPISQIEQKQKFCWQKWITCLQKVEMFEHWNQEAFW